MLRYLTNDIRNDSCRDYDAANVILSETEILNSDKTLATIETFLL